MRKKYEAKSSLDILRFFDRLGIDLIINNETLYDQFCQKVMQSVQENERRTYFQPDERIINKFVNDKLRANKVNWNDIKNFRRASKLEIPQQL